jgi:biopolymer transport protein ExbB
MPDSKLKTPIIALIGALALMTSVPALAQTAAPSPADSAAAASAAPADSSAAASAAAPADSSAAAGDQASSSTKSAGQLNAFTMFINATWPVKTVIIGLFLCSALSWMTLVIKIVQFRSLNTESDRFLEAFRSARSIAEINRIATAEEYEGNPMADMAAAASSEVELSRQAGLSVTGEHADSVVARAGSAVTAVQASLAKRMSDGMAFLASLGSNAPFVGLFGTVYGIMVSFINITNSGTTNLAAVAPGIAEALLATGFGLFAAIPAVVFYNYFQTRISSYGTRLKALSPS